MIWRFKAIAVALAFMLFAGGAAAKDWQRAESHHFIIYSDGSASLLEEFTHRAEMFDALFRLYFQAQPVEDPAKLTIFVLKDAAAVSDLAGNDQGTLAGFYRSSREGSFAVSNRRRQRRETALSGQTVLFHEYVHHLMARYFTYAYPAWYREGFAEYFATATFERDGMWTLGQPANHRAYALQRVNIALEDVLFKDPGDFDSRGIDAYYGRSWLMVHYFANNHQRRPQMTEYLLLLGQGVEPREAAAQSFGDLDALDDELDSYLQGRFNHLVGGEPIPYFDDIVVEQLDEAASALTELNMRRRVGYTREETRDDLRELAAEYPANVEILAELALAERDFAQLAEDDHDYTLALAAADNALALAPQHGRTNVLKANLMMHSFDEDVSQSDEVWAEVRRLIALGEASDTSRTLAQLAAYDSYMRQGDAPPVPVVNGLGSAFSSVPEVHNIRLQYAYALANEGLFDDAIGLIEFLVGDPHYGRAGRIALDQLRSMRDGRPDVPPAEIEQTTGEPTDE